MPIVTALGNKNLTPDHWNDIKELTNIDLELENLDFCLGELMERNIASFQEEIQDISMRATQEAKLQIELQEISNIWNSIELIVKQYKEVYFVISELEELQLELDDMMTNINNILGNRYVAKLKKAASALFDQLSLFLDIFDQWKDCQRNWLYLENIFVSEDIKQQTKADYNEFEKVNKRLNELMKNVNKVPKVKNFAKKEIFKELKKNNEAMDTIQKNLETFLENKRLDFPRFFFISNDELLQILAAAKDIRKVEKHLNKIFENIMKLELGTDKASNQILKMISAEGEHVAFSSSVKIKPDEKIEYTLKEIEDKMFETIKKRIYNSRFEYDVVKTDRKEWVLSNEIGQVITTVSQIIWTEICEAYIEGMQESRYTALDFVLEEIILKQLTELTSLIGGKLHPVKRKVLISLITADVHNRDIVKGLIEDRVDSVDNFEWQKQLRYYNSENEPCYIKQVNATLYYGNEYMGVASRLVITPLTDRCWMTITGALHIKLGAAPAGPAGTGKTESTKDLAKALGIQCVVFNCSEQIEYKMMARLFSGLVSQGAWACLDEFNRIDEEVLSVIAQQLLTIKFALLKELKEFEFNDVILKLNSM
jgi:dynein heavy chain, axonemal